MALIEELERVLGGFFPYRLATNLEFVLVASFLVAGFATWVAMPLLIRKLRGAGILGRDVNKPGAPEVPEMGGLGWFLGFYSGVFVALAFRLLNGELEPLYLAALITVAGAAMAGILDDLIKLRQRFKAFISFVFAAPMVVFASDYTIAIPLLGDVGFGLWYPLLLVPLGIAAAAQTMNMLEGFNGLSAGNSLLIGLGLLAVSILRDDATVLPLLAPFLAATLVFLAYNRHPARVFPGDIFTLSTGALLACVAIIGDMEVAGVIMFAPQILEFGMKFLRDLPSGEWWGDLDDEGLLHCPPGGPVGLPQWVMKRTGGVTEPRLVMWLWGIQALFVALGVGVAML